MTCHESIDSRFLSLLDGLENRGEMYLTDYRYSTVVDYLLGFSMAESIYGAGHVMGSFPDFIQGKIGYPCSAHWGSAIKNILADGDEKKALPMLFSLLREYLQQRC